MPPLRPAPQGKIRTGKVGTGAREARRVTSTRPNASWATHSSWGTEISKQANIQQRVVGTMPKENQGGRDGGQGVTNYKLAFHIRVSGGPLQWVLSERRPEGSKRRVLCRSGGGHCGQGNSRHKRL